MKKTLAFVLALCLCVGLSGCVSKEEKEAAQKVKVMIENIGEVTLDSEVAIEEAQAAYNNLPEKAQKLVDNYAVLEDAQGKMFEVFTAELNKMTDTLNAVDKATDAYDMVKVQTLVDEAKPIAEKLEASKYFNGESPVEALNKCYEMIEMACYPNSRIISLDSYIKLAKVSNATADSNEGETCNVDSDTGMEYYTYFYDGVSDMLDAFSAYTDYLDLYFEQTDADIDVTETRYTYVDELGRPFYVERNYYDLGRFGAVYAVFVGFDPEFGQKAALGK